jgi:succinate dehydrogenase / fumarate reductase cytochrome b subunit
MDDFKITLTGLTRYSGRSGQLSFILHRVTGLGTLLFLSFHILDTATVFFAPSLYQHAIDLYRNSIFMILEIVLVFCVIYHGVNGLRIAISDLLAPKWWKLDTTQKTMVWTLTVAIILWLPAAIVMGRNLLVYNFGL